MKTPLEIQYHWQLTIYSTENLKAFQYPIIGLIQAASILFLFVLAGWQISLGNLTGGKFVSYATAIALTIALVGASGAGKSTILSLLNRFHDVSAGSISIDGIDIRDVTLKSLRHQIEIVPQDTVLLSGHIAQNIAFGQIKFDIKDVEEAAKIANAHQFISQLSQGYYTYVGEKGTTLSGGQKQRIAIARAVLFNPRILILDEATSALDSESEALVQEALERIMADRTVFIIAHRLATVRKADRILAIENGEIIDRLHFSLGSHQIGFSRKITRLRRSIEFQTIAHLNIFLLKW